MADPKTDAAYQEAIKQWEEKGYKVTPKLAAPDLSWVQDWANWNKAVMEAIKLIFGDREVWGYWGALTIYAIGEGSLTQDQMKEIDAIKAILAKPTAEMTMTDIGEMQGRLIHLISPDLRALLQGRAPGLVMVLDILARIGGAA